MKLMSDAISEHIDKCEAIGLAPSTISGRKTNLRTWHRWCGERSIDSITPVDIQNYVLHLRRALTVRHKPYTPSSIHTMLESVRLMFEMCVERGYIQRSPVTIKVPREDGNANDKTMSIDELVKVWDYIRKRKRNHERSIFVLIALADSGIRRGELAGLRIRDVDTESRVMFLDREKTKDEQVLPISLAFVDAYNMWLAARPTVEHDVVLTLENGDPITPDAVSGTIRRMTRVATGIERGPHSIRHAWFSEAINQCGVSVAVAQGIAGHTTPDMTLSYVRDDLSAQRRAIDSGPLLRYIVEPPQEDGDFYVAYSDEGVRVVFAESCR